MNLSGDVLESSWTQQLTAQAQALGFRLAGAAVVVLILWGLTWLTLRAVDRTLRRASPDPNARLLVDRFVQFGFLLLGISWVLSIMGVQLTALVAVIGAASLAISLSLQDVLKNLVAGLIILVERPFTIGEHIDFRTFSGIVETIELRTTVLRTTTGQRVVIPNAMLFSEALVNRSAYGRQLVRLRIAVPLPSTTAEGGPAPPPAPSEMPEGMPAGVPEGMPAGVPEGMPGERLGDEVLAAVRSAGISGAPVPSGQSGPFAPFVQLGQLGQLGPFGKQTAPERATASPETPAEAAVLVEALSEAKATLRAEVWTHDPRAAVPRLVWALRRRIPSAEINVLE